jgi:hypothetical protein
MPANGSDWSIIQPSVCAQVQPAVSDDAVRTSPSNSNECSSASLRSASRVAKW